jgi:Zn-dependent protease with chaperone function
MNTARWQSLFRSILTITYTLWFVVSTEVVFNLAASYWLRTHLQNFSLILILPFLPIALLLVVPAGRDAFWFALYFAAIATMPDALFLVWTPLIAGLHFLPLIWLAVLAGLVGATWRSSRIRLAGLSGLIYGFYVLPVLQIILGAYGLRTSSRVSYDNQYNFMLFGFGWMRLIAGIILFLLLWPRRTRFDFGTPFLDLASYPKLCQLLQETATATGTGVPRLVCLTYTANVAVAETNTLLGFGGEKVLALGAPSLAVLSQENLRSLLAHEFGHFSRDHLGPHVRAYQGISALKHLYSGSFWTKGIGPTAARALFGVPGLKLFNFMYSSLLNAVGKDFELEADSVAAALTGKQATIEALRELVTANLCLEAYLRERGPGNEGPNLELFREFCLSSEAAEIRTTVVPRLESLPTTQADAYPSLGDRFRAIQKLPASEVQSHSAEKQPAYLLFGSTLDGISHPIEMWDHLRPVAEAKSKREKERANAPATVSSPGLALSIGAIPQRPRGVVRGGFSLEQPGSPRENRWQTLKLVARSVALTSVLLAPPFIVAGYNSFQFYTLLEENGFKLGRDHLNRLRLYYLESRYSIVSWPSSQSLRESDAFAFWYLKFHATDLHNLWDGTSVESGRFGEFHPEGQRVGPFVFKIAEIPRSILKRDGSTAIARDLQQMMSGYPQLTKLDEKADANGFIVYQSQLSEGIELTVLTKTQDNEILTMEVYGLRGDYQNWAQRDLFESHIIIRSAQR